MTPALLREIGEALYGPTWQSDLARAVGVNDRTVRRWAAAESPMPDSLRGELAALLRARHATAGALLERLAA